MALILKGFALPQVIIFFPGAYANSTYLGGVEENSEENMGMSDLTLVLLWSLPLRDTVLLMQIR